MRATPNDLAPGVILKRSVSIRGHRTSVTLEEPFWQYLEECSRAKNLSVAEVIASVDEAREPDSNLSSALRVFLFTDLLARLPRESTGD